jgi:hypothetical protein
MAAAAQKRYEFTVTGRGEFPIVMLGKDACWPKRESEDAAGIAATFFPRRSNDERTITLIGVNSPNAPRWKSWGWTVLNVREFKI